jgi:hypothetical protein
MAFSLRTPKTSALVGLVNPSTSTAYSSPLVTTRTSKPVRVDSATATSNKCVFPCDLNHALLWFIGTDAANEDFEAKVILWRLAGNLTEIRPTAASNNALYFGIHAGTFDITLGAMTGQASTVVANTYFFADTIVAGTVSASIVRDVWSPADDTAGHVLIDTLGYNYLEVQFDKDAGPIGSSVVAASCNAVMASL